MFAVVVGNSDAHVGVDSTAVTYLVELEGEVDASRRCPSSQYIALQATRMKLQFVIVYSCCSPLE